MTQSVTWTNINAFIASNIQTYFTPIFNKTSSTPIDININNTCIFWSYYKVQFDDQTATYNTAFIIKARTTPESIIDSFLAFVRDNPQLDYNAVLFNLDSLEITIGSDGWCTVFFDTDITVGL